MHVIMINDTSRMRLSARMQARVRAWTCKSYPPLRPCRFAGVRSSVRVRVYQGNGKSLRTA